MGRSTSWNSYGAWRPTIAKPFTESYRGRLRNPKQQGYVARIEMDDYFQNWIDELRAEMRNSTVGWREADFERQLASAWDMPGSLVDRAAVTIAQGWPRKPTTTLNTNPGIRVREIVPYGGGHSSGPSGDGLSEIRIPSKKWIYIFKFVGDKPLLIAEGKTPEVEQTRSPDGSLQPPSFAPLVNFRANMGGIAASAPGQDEKLDQVRQDSIDPGMGPKDEPGNFALFLSPIRLTQAGVDILREGWGNGEGYRSLTRVRRYGNATGMAACPDPFRLAALVQQHWHEPAMERLLAFVEDETIQKQAFIASTVSSWAHHPSTPEEVKREIAAADADAWLNKNRAIDHQNRIGLDEGALFLSHIVNSAGYRAIERSALDRGGLDLSRALQNIAVVSKGLVLSDWGRASLVEMLGNRNRVLTRFVTSDLGQFSFSASRYAFLAAKEMLVHVVAGIVQNTDWARAVRSTAGIQSAPHQIEKILGSLFRDEGRSVQRIASVPGARGGFVLRGSGTDIPATVKDVRKAMKSADHVFEEVEELVEGWALPIAVVFEAANFALAFAEAWNAKVDRAGAWVQVVGSGADLLDYGSSSYQRLSRSTSPRLAGWVGAFAVVGGLVDAWAFARDAVVAAEEGDHNKLWGHGLSAAGSLAGAVSGGFGVLGSLGWRAAAIFIPWLSVIGGVFIFLGVVGAADRGPKTPYGQFSVRAFFNPRRNTYTRLTSEIWVDGNLPTSNLDKEVRTLLRLSAAFSMRMEGDHVKLLPGMIHGAGEFLVQVRTTFGDDANRVQAEFRDSFRVDTKERRFVHDQWRGQSSGRLTLSDGDVITKGGEISEIRFPTRPPTSGGREPLRPTSTRVLVAVRFLNQISSDYVWLPAPGRFLRCDDRMRGKPYVSVLDESDLEYDAFQVSRLR